MEYNIIRYSKEYKEKTERYLHKISPEFSCEYIQYNIEHSDSVEESQKPFLILNSHGEIVGCHFYYPVKAFIKGKEVTTCWGHDTYVDEEYRESCSIEFILKINRVPAFGIGVSDKNKSIQKSIRTAFIPGLYTYCFANYYSILLGLFTKKRIENYKSPSVTKVKNFVFERVEKSSEILYLNNGYWYKDVNDVDFIRDKEYLDDRFFNNKAFNYYTYTVRGKALYFVVRPILFRGLPMLSLVDYRYDVSDNITVHEIIKASQKIAKQNQLAGVVLVCNDKQLKESWKGKLSIKRETTLLANKYLKLSSDTTTFVTSADADVDYLRF